MFIRGQSSFCVPVDRSLQNGPSNSLAETYHTMTKTKNVGKGQWINEQVFHTVGFSTGKPEAVLCLALASSIWRCCSLLCRGTYNLRKRGHTLLQKSWCAVERTRRKLAFLLVLPSSVQKRNPEGGGKATIISLLLDTKLQSFLSHRNISQKCMQARYTENPEQETVTGLEEEKKNGI